jgi:alpha-tubulin suppressor-like RCC1 family protein
MRRSFFLLLVTTAAAALAAACSSSVTNESSSSSATAGGSQPDRTPLHVKQIALGTLHSCAILADDTVACWGDGAQGQLGTGKSGPGYHEPFPTAVPGLTGVTRLVLAWNESCAILSDGSVQCWGDARYGQLGNGKQGDGYIEAKPVAVTGLSGVLDLALNAQSACAVRGDGSVACWGSNSDGALGFESPMCGPYLVTIGDGGPVPMMSPCEVAPREVSGVTGAIEITAGGDHQCALLGDHTVSCWGEDTFGQLGDGMQGTGVTQSPSLIAGFSAEHVAAGFVYNCALLADETVNCWGDNSFGELGIGTQALDSFKTTPSPVPSLSGVKAMKVTNNSSLALLSDGSALAWGDVNYLFEVEPVPGSAAADSPTKMTWVKDAVDVVTSGFHSCARYADETVVCWGANDKGQLGNGVGGPMTELDYSMLPVIR